MAEIIFIPKFVCRAASIITLTDANTSKLFLMMPGEDCAAMVYAALLHNLPTGAKK